MADHAVEDNDAGNVDIFVFRGRQAPKHITHARIDESVEVVKGRAFVDCKKMVHVETHNRIRNIGVEAFFGCKSLPRIDLRSVIEIGIGGFGGCEKLQIVEFGGKLESIGGRAFFGCPIEHLKLPSVVNVKLNAFAYCKRLIDVEFSEKLESVSSFAFYGCERLQRIAIPLKRGLFPGHTVFDSCYQLTRVDLVGGVQKTVSSLHMEIWREEMNTEINRINLILPDAASIDKTQTVRDWMDSVIDRLVYYKAEHTSYIKEAAKLLELALWKAKLDEKEDHDCCKESTAKKAKIDADDERKDCRITCGADTVIKNVIPFLRLLE